MDKRRFKIDFSEYSSRNFYQLFYWEKQSWSRGRWRPVGDSQQTFAEAKAIYELVKDLPEYLP